MYEEMKKISKKVVVTVCESSDDDISTMQFEHVKLKTLRGTQSESSHQRIVNGLKNCDEFVVWSKIDGTQTDEDPSVMFSTTKIEGLPAFVPDSEVWTFLP